MTKQSGLGHHLYVGGVDVSGDISALDTISTPLAMIDVTGIDKSANERIPGLRDGTLSFTSYFNPAVGQEHGVFKTLPTADVSALYATGSTIGVPAYALVGKQLDYAGSRDASGAFTFKVQAQANGFGADWGELLTAGKRTDTTATNGTSFNAGAATSFGFTAYLSVFTFTGTSVVVKLQDSADNSSFADVTSGAFPAATTAPGWGRLSVGGTATLRQYVRVSTTGTFTNATFSVMVVRNRAAVNI
jgi:hypothetical protein